jgi:hypothetical protein
MLISRLLDRTRSDDLSWKESNNDDAFILNFPDSSIEIDYYISDDSYGVCIYNDSGKVIDSNRYAPTNLEYYKLQELYRIARRKALNVDETIDGILARLA